MLVSLDPDPLPWQVLLSLNPDPTPPMAGAGIPNVDFLVIVTADEVKPCAPVKTGGSGVVAYASTCDTAGASLDGGSGRPVIGSINFCQ